ncbi:TPA: hypothetical protein VAM27_000183 [Acinetobacter baumannii]|uniref:Uncharacterized protein n=1 Tax=Acinetobacter baumannii (strain 1295743) TaxID=1310613 RepID=A0A009I856_ACIB9|nr:hypothetical protein [Acinetobacter baumannii]EXB06631.1 hypothetical protein J512_1218 [Acinetobacter baumannii 1295743]MCZ3007856.1 hypothetical protein [Acinetobacter baumannii]TPT83957.1 hypothetical protein FJU52_11920 [Acinetobacter baumannii]HEO1791334.1 hypothetical protein [Acinetobacter baumannii]
METKSTNQVAQTKQQRALSLSEKLILGAGTAGISSLALAADGPDVSAGTAVIATAALVIGTIGAAKIVPQATMQVWAFVKQAFNRT